MDLMTATHQCAQALPHPLAPADCDLRDFPHMQLDVQRLRDSRFASHSTGDGFRAGVLLWSASWHQIPAGSVPDDDIELAQLTGYGRVTSEFAKVKAEALHGFVLCSDNRWYHAIVSQKACAAWESKLAYAFKKLDDRLRKENKKRAEEGRELTGIPTIDQWKYENFPATAAFDARANKPSSAENTASDSLFPPEISRIPTENPVAAAVGTPEFQRKQLLKGEGEGYLIPPIPPPGAKVRRPASQTDPDGFDVFYAAYPRKVGRGAAVKAWAKLTPDERTRTEILTALTLQRPKLDWREGGRFIPHPSTWLNEERWKDEIAFAGSDDDLYRGAR
ncbi:hypothetical protein BH10PSE18_BH10PSE18_08090 [soil metagenome]